MQNIIDYFNTFLHVIFGNSVSLYSPSVVIDWINEAGELASSLENFIIILSQNIQYLLSLFVWVWFAVLTVNLLLIFPYRWIRSVIRKCRL